MVWPKRDELGRASDWRFRGRRFTTATDLQCEISQREISVAERIFQHVVTISPVAW